MISLPSFLNGISGGTIVGSPAFTISHPTLPGIKFLRSDVPYAGNVQFDGFYLKVDTSSGMIFPNANPTISASAFAAANVLRLQSNVNNGASAVAVAINSGSALSTAGAKILSIQNNGSEKASFDKDGGFSFSGVATSTVADGASAEALKLGSSTTFSTAGASLLCVENNGTDKFRVTYFGGNVFAGITTTAINALAGADLRAGTMVYDSTLNKFKFYNGSAWETITSA